MFCKNCGKPVEDGATYCRACGAAIATPEVHTQMSNTLRKPDEGRGYYREFFQAAWAFESKAIYQKITCVSRSGIPLHFLAFCRAR